MTRYRAALPDHIGMAQDLAPEALVLTTGSPATPSAGTSDALAGSKPAGSTRPDSLAD